VNDPKRRSSTRSPLTKAVAILSKMLLTTFSTALLDRCGFCAATRKINCDLIMLLPPDGTRKSQGHAAIVKHGRRAGHFWTNGTQPRESREYSFPSAAAFNNSTHASANATGKRKH
jgi:hypothetical protein